MLWALIAPPYLFCNWNELDRSWKAWFSALLAQQNSLFSAYLLDFCSGSGQWYRVFLSQTLIWITFIGIFRLSILSLNFPLRILENPFNGVLIEIVCCNESSLSLFCFFSFKDKNPWSLVQWLQKHSWYILFLSNKWALCSKTLCIRQWLLFTENSLTAGYFYKLYNNFHVS